MSSLRFIIVSYKKNPLVLQQETKYALESFCCKKNPNQEIGLGRFWE